MYIKCIQLLGKISANSITILTSINWTFYETQFFDINISQANLHSINFKAIVMVNASLVEVNLSNSNMD